MPGESIDENFETVSTNNENSDLGEKLLETLEQQRSKLNIDSHGFSQDSNVIECPYCLSDVFIRATHCKGCGHELTQYLAAARMITQLQYNATSKPDNLQQAKIESDQLAAYQSDSTRPGSPLKSFIYAAMVPSLMFIVLSYLSLWGTRLKTTQWGPIILVIGVFVICALIGASHVRERQVNLVSKWFYLLWGGILGIWITILQSTLQYVLDGHLPTVQEEYFELINAVLGGLFAYIAGAAIPITQNALNNSKATLSSFIEVFWKIRFSLVSAIFSLLIGFLR